MSASTIPVTLPCFISIGDCAFDVEAEVSYNQIGTTVAIESVTLNGCPVNLEQDQYEELADAVRDQLILNDEDEDNDD